MKPNILYLDFETSPIVGWGWRAWETDLFHIEEDVKIITVAWAVNDGPVYCVGIDDFPGYKPGVRNINDKKLVQYFLKKFDSADIVVAQNGFGFDFKLWRTRMIVHGLAPHHEPKELDTKRWAAKFLFTSKGQDGISRQLGTSRKIETDKNLHYKCIELGLPKYWRQMKVYNKGDVKGLRENAKKLAPFIQTLPNNNIYTGQRMFCTNPLCPEPGTMMRIDKYRATSTGRKIQYRCKACCHYATGPAVSANIILR